MTSYQYWKLRVAQGRELCACGNVGRTISGNEVICERCREISRRNDESRLRRTENHRWAVEPYRIHCSV